MSSDKTHDLNLNLSLSEWWMSFQIANPKSHAYLYVYKRGNYSIFLNKKWTDILVPSQCTCILESSESNLSVTKILNVKWPGVVKRWDTKSIFGHPIITIFCFWPCNSTTRNLWLMHYQYQTNLAILFQRWICIFWK